MNIIVDGENLPKQAMMNKIEEDKVKHALKWRE